MSVQFPLWEERDDAVYVEDFGAVPDGVTDCSPAIQVAVEESRRRGGVPVLSRTGGTFRITEPIRFDGCQLGAP